eukprot:566312-Alexandrium_andersonii.AAC.1
MAEARCYCEVSCQSGFARGQAQDLPGRGWQTQGFEREAGCQGQFFGLQAPPTHRSPAARLPQV